MYTELLNELTRFDVLTGSLKGIIENFSFNSAIMIVMMIFCVVGGVDKIRVNRRGYGEKFDEAFAALKPLALAMIGVITLVPVLQLLLEPVITPVYEFFGASPAMFAGTLLPVDCGAYPLAMELAGGDTALGSFSGIVLGSTFGLLIVGNIPICLSVLDKKYHNGFGMAVLVSVITIPIGCFLGGLAMNLTPHKLTVGEILVNLIPVTIVALLVALGLILRPKQVLAGFCAIGNAMQVILVAGIVISAVQALTGLRLPLFRLMVEPSVPGGNSPLTESLIIVGNIALILAGAFPMVLWISRVFKKPIAALSRLLGMDEHGGAALIASLASVFPALDLVPKMNSRTRLLILSFLICGSFVFGDHLGFTAGVDQNMILPMIVAKLSAGVSAMLLAGILAPRLLKNE